MGCDIHGWVETKVGDKWVAVKELKDRDSNYMRFGKLANVREDGPPARGLPPDISDTTKLHVDVWDGDGHSHSWLPIADAAKIFLETQWVPDTPEAKERFDKWTSKFPEYEYFGLEENDYSNYRLVFWFDN